MQSHMFTCGQNSGHRAVAAPMVSAQMPNANRQATQAQFLSSMGVQAPVAAHMVASQPPVPSTIEESMEYDHMIGDKMLEAGLGPQDLALLNATRLSAVLPATTFMTPHEQKQQKKLH
jgi:hypothetical protein